MELPFRLSCLGPRGDSHATPGHPAEPFFQALGHFAVSRHDTLWYSAGRFSLVTFPNNRKVACTKRDVQQLLVDCGRLAAVFCPQSGSGPLVKEYWLHAKHYGLSRLQEQFRKHVRRHSGEFIAREVSWDEMATAALAIHADTAARRQDSMPAFTDRRRWASACDAAARIPGLAAYGCLMNDALAAYVVSWQECDACHGVMINRNSVFDPQRAANVLLYSFSHDQIGRTDTSMINLGRSWYPPKPSLDSFKRHAGYEERETAVAIVLHPRIERFMRAPLTHRCLEHVGRLTGGRLNFENDLRLFEAARLTDIP
jgi:hypothetical protein